MSISNTSIINMALGKISSKRITNYEDATENSPQAIQGRLHFEQTRDALIRSHYWRFASDRSSLTQDATDPEGDEYDNQFILPTDFLRLKSVFGNNYTATENTKYTFAIEGDRLLTNESSVDIRYIKKVTDPTKFDPLFVEVLILSLALKMLPALAGGDSKLYKDIQTELRLLVPSVRTLDRQETNTIGRNNRRPWLESRLSGGSISRSRV